MYRICKKTDPDTVTIFASRPYSYRKKTFLPYELDKVLFAFAQNNFADKEAVDKLISCQDKFRKLFQFQDEIVALYQAIGYMGQRSDEISEYLFSKIRQGDKRDPEECPNRSYFLGFCLTYAAKINPLATKLLLSLWQPEVNKHDGETIDGIRDSRKLFDIASPEVIEYLFSERLGTENGPIPVFEYMNRVLGNKPLVKCQTINENGDYEFTTVDFSDKVLSLLVHKPPYNPTIPLYMWLSKWCNNDSIFKSKALIAVNDKNIDRDIIYLSRYLPIALKDVSGNYEMIKTVLGDKYNERDKEEIEFLKGQIEKFKNDIQSLSSKNRICRNEVFKYWEHAAANQRYLNNYAHFAFDYIEMNRSMLNQIINNNTSSRIGF